MARGFVHDRILLDPVEALCRQSGGRTYREYRIGTGRCAGIVDLYVEFRSYGIAIEAELSPDRVENDVTKATTLGVDLLLILVPDWRVARAVSRRLHRSGGPPIPEELEIWILTLGQALQRLRKKCHLMTDLKVRTTSSHQSPVGTPRQPTPSLQQGGTDA